MGTSIDYLNAFAQKYPPLKGFREPGVSMIYNKRLYQANLFIKERLPAELLATYAKLPYFGNAKLKKQSEMLMKLSGKMDKLQELLFYFVTNQWIF
jgi:hypothetical protein